MMMELVTDTYNKRLAACTFTFVKERADGQPEPRTASGAYSNLHRACEKLGARCFRGEGPENVVVFRSPAARAELTESLLRDAPEFVASAFCEPPWLAWCIKGGAMHRRGVGEKATSKNCRSCGRGTKRAAPDEEVPCP